MKYTCIVALIAMLSTGCTTCASKSLPFHCKISNKFSYNHKNIIFDAMSIWNDALNTEAFIIDDGFYPIYDGSEESKFKNIITITPIYDYDEIKLGSTHRLSCNIEMNQGGFDREFDNSVLIKGKSIKKALSLKNTKFRTVMLHELGHALGATHSKKESVMNKKNSNKYTDCIDEESIKQLCKNRDCSRFNAVATCN